MISSAADLGRFAAMMLSDGCNPSGQRILPNTVVQAAMADQTHALTLQPGFMGAGRAWGYGWRRHWATHPASFGDFLSGNAVGHWGATGTLLWFDPTTQQFAAILTTTPYEDSRSVIQRISNVIAAS